MKHFLSIIAMLFISMMAFAENDVGKSETSYSDSPTATISTMIQAPAVCAYEFHDYSATFECAVVVENDDVPSPKVYPVPKFMLIRYYTTSTTITNWRHRAYGNSMNLRYTNSTYKR